MLSNVIPAHCNFFTMGGSLVLYAGSKEVFNLLDFGGKT